jgi:hypothetical protein
MLCISYGDLYYVLYNNISYYDDVLAVELSVGNFVAVLVELSFFLNFWWRSVIWFYYGMWLLIVDDVQYLYYFPFSFKFKFNSVVHFLNGRAQRPRINLRAIFQLWFSTHETRYLWNVIQYYVITGPNTWYGEEVTVKERRNRASRYIDRIVA